LPAGYASYDKLTTATAPVFFSDAPEQEKVVRGGSIAGGYPFMRCAVRYTIPYDANFYGFVGMRVVLAPKIDVVPPTQK